MALCEVKQVLLRAATDPGFRKALMEDPDNVFVRFNLTEEEKQSLRGLSEDRIAEAVGGPDSDMTWISMNDIRI